MTEPQKSIDRPKPVPSPYGHGVPVAPMPYQKPLMKLMNQMQHPRTKISSKNWKKKHTYY